jgi:hypothetical protein
VARSDKVGEILSKLDVSTPTQTRPKRLAEPQAIPPAEPIQAPLIHHPSRQQDPWELEKDKRYRVDLSALLKIHIPTAPGQEPTQSQRAVNYLMFDNAFDYLCSDRYEGYGVPRLDGQEQAMYYWFYRFSYGFGYSACAMSDATLMQRLGWVRKHVKSVLMRLLQKRIIRIEAEFPMFLHRRPQVYFVYLPRQIIANAFAQVPMNDIPEEARQWIREFTKDRPV